ncbi:MAG: extracellular solute-binding protein [Clostridia bacterium]|nr:extracellular solute-binding protein [Clostridia bacterium]
MKIFSKIYPILVFLFLYAPILVLVIFSFNASSSTSMFAGFSFQWYKTLFEDETTFRALYNTIILAICSSLVATVLGTAAAVGIDKLKKGPARSGIMAVTNIPMMNPEIVTGISMMLLFVFAGRLVSKSAVLGFGTMLIAHVTFSLPYVILNVLPKLRQTDRNLAEAAQDLGCKPVSAFFKVVLPSIMPGVITGFIMSFTLSLDDFIISYFTSGPGFQTLPIAIFSMTKKRVKPDMYALSAIIFVSILVLLIFYNIAQQKSEDRDRGKEKTTKSKTFGVIKTVVAVSLVAAVILVPLIVKFVKPKTESVGSLKGTTLYVYNWGEYISDGADDTVDVIAEFEKRFGIEVVYDTFDNNETMYSKLKGGGVSYDIVIPSDYMIERMISEDMLAKIDYSNIPNYKYIPEQYRGLGHDPTDEYSVPYTVGMVGLIYNTAMVEEAPTSWTALWNTDYTGNILMFNNPRDAFAIAQSILDIDYNTENEADWNRAAAVLKSQKNVSPTYVSDEVFNMMESGEAAFAPYYAGDFLSMQENNPDLALVYPKEGVNFFVDSICILKDAKNKRAAELFINFMLEPEIALANAEYICYASPHTEVYSNPEYSYYQNEYLYPEEGQFKTQNFLNLSPETLALMSSLWDDVKNYVPDPNDAEIVFTPLKDTDTDTTAPAETVMTAEAWQYVIYIGIFVAVCLAYVIFRYARKKYRENV